MLGQLFDREAEEAVGHGAYKNSPRGEFLVSSERLTAHLDTAPWPDYV